MWNIRSAVLARRQGNGWKGGGLNCNSGLDFIRFFNTSGNLYKEMKLKDKLPQMDQDEKYDLLATDGMLVKRPIVVAGNTVLVGFKEGEWEQGL